MRIINSLILLILFSFNLRKIISISSQLKFWISTNNLIVVEIFRNEKKFMVHPLAGSRHQNGCYSMEQSMKIMNKKILTVGSLYQTNWWYFQMYFIGIIHFYCLILIFGFVVQTIETTFSQIFHKIAFFLNSNITKPQKWN